MTTTGAPVCILAGAGSGKTRVLTRRIAYRIATGTADPRHVLALTFTRKAATELGRRLEVLGVRGHVTAGTFHALAYAQLRQRWADGHRSPPSLLERKVGLLARLQAGGRGRAAASTAQPADLAGEIEWAKARMVGPDGYEGEVARLQRTTPLVPAAMADLYRRYEEEKRRRGLVDFDDLLVDLARAMAADADFAASQRWRFRHLFVDEYQDVNPVQACLLAGWRGAGDDLCVVGDCNQAIYSWNGADPDQLRHFPTREPKATVVVLDDNFRSSPQILAVAGALVDRGPGASGPLRPRRGDGPLPSVRTYERDVDEARAIARAVRDRHAPGTRWSQVAVLTRTNAQLVAFEAAFRAAGIPVRIRGGGAFLERPEVKEALAGLGRPDAPLGPGLADVAAAAEEQPAGAGAAAEERRAVVDELVRLGREYVALDVEPTVAGFTAWLAAGLRSEAPAATADAVDLATFHAAKGLEWPVVFLAGLERGLVPISHATSEESRAEERRLLYVAVTRAERELHCSWARQRTFGARALRRQPSPWLEEISAARAALAGNERPGSAAWRSRLAEERARIRGGQGGRSGRSGVGVGNGADPALLGALKRWRADAARAGGVPAYVVFHDTTLAAVAEARPRSTASLLRLPGLGPVKAERYGDALLAVIAEHDGGPHAPPLTVASGGATTEP